MKSDFTLAKEELRRIGIIRVVSDFYSTPKRKGSCYFVKSPKTTDKTASLAVYPSTNRYVDYANGNCSGDAIGFVAYIRGCNQWQALNELRDFYGLTNAREQDAQEIRRRIKLQEEQERRRREREQEFCKAFWAHIDDLKCLENIYASAIEKGLYEPLSDLQSYCINELQKVRYKLEILCGIDCESYRRMKSNAEKGLSDDSLQWLLDCLSIMAEGGIFVPTNKELEEIRRQRDFELTRKPGIDRVCSIKWAEHIWRNEGV